MGFIYSVKQSKSLDFSYNIFVLLLFLLSARVPENDSDSALPKSDEKLIFISLTVSAWKEWRNSLIFFFLLRYQKKPLWINISKVNCLPSFPA